MKIRSDIITMADVRQAFAAARAGHGADIWIDESRTFKPRRYHYGVEVWAESMNGKRATGHHAIGSVSGGEAQYLPRAASWTDYGYVIAALYNLDPDAQIGSYDSEADFVASVRRYVPRGESLDFLKVLRAREEGNS